VAAAASRETTAPAHIASNQDLSHPLIHLELRRGILKLSRNIAFPLEAAARDAQGLRIVVN
jgi:hypothetical protein